MLSRYATANDTWPALYACIRVCVCLFFCPFQHLLPQHTRTTRPASAQELTFKILLIRSQRKQLLIRSPLLKRSKGQMDFDFRKQANLFLMHLQRDIW